MTDATMAALAMELGLLNSEHSPSEDLLIQVYDGLLEITTDDDAGRVHYGPTLSLLPNRN